MNGRAQPPVPATRPCPGGCGRRIDLRSVACPDCVRQLPVEISEGLAGTSPGTLAHQRWRTAARYALEQPTVVRERDRERPIDRLRRTIGGTC